MRFLKITYLLAICFIISFSSCTKVRDDEVYPLEGDILIDREVIGVGQPITFQFPISFQLPSGVLDIDTPYFETKLKHDYGEKKECGIKDGFYHEKIYFTEPETGEIAFNLNYILNHPDKTGSKEYLNTIVKEIAVVECDVKTSFWNDSKSLTELNIEQKLKPIPEMSDSYNIKELRSSDISQKGGEFANDKNIQVEYSFENDHLKMVVEEDKFINVTSPGHIIYTYMSYANLHYGTEILENRKWTVTTQGASDLLSRECDKCLEDMFAKNLSVEKREEACLKLSDLIIKYEINLSLSYTYRNTSVVMSYVYKTKTMMDSFSLISSLVLENKAKNKFNSLNAKNDKLRDLLSVSEEEKTEANSKTMSIATYFSPINR